MEIKKDCYIDFYKNREISIYKLYGEHIIDIYNIIDKDRIILTLEEFEITELKKIIKHIEDSIKKREEQKND